MQLIGETVCLKHLKVGEQMIFPATGEALAHEQVWIRGSEVFKIEKIDADKEIVFVRNFLGYLCKYWIPDFENYLQENNFSLEENPAKVPTEKLPIPSSETF